jgi:predicted dehydrogenase
MGDLAPHMINAALALIGPIAEVMAEVETVHEKPPRRPVDNDDQGQMMCRFENGAMGHLYFSRIATGRKMGYAYEITAPRARSASIRKTRTRSGSTGWTGRKPSAVSARS